MEGYSCIKNRGVHEDRKHDEGCEGAHRRNFAVCYLLPSIPCFVDVLRYLLLVWTYQQH